MILRTPASAARIAAVFTFIALPAAAQVPVEFNFAGQQCFHYDTPVPAKSMLAICGPLPRDEIVLWKFNAGADLPVAVRREGDESPRVSHAASRGTGGQFVVPADGRYCWTWRNTGAQPVPFAMEMEHP